MTIKKNSRQQDLQITTDGHIFLTIAIGNAQLGSNILTIKGDANPIAKGDITNLDLGAAADLRGKTLSILTNILDTNDDSTATVATYTFTGVTPPVTTDNNNVDNDGDVYSLSIDFNFK